MDSISIVVLEVKERADLTISNDLEGHDHVSAPLQDQFYSMHCLGSESIQAEQRKQTEKPAISNSICTIAMLELSKVNKAFQLI